MLRHRSILVAVVAAGILAVDAAPSEAQANNARARLRRLQQQNQARSNPVIINSFNTNAGFNPFLPPGYFPTTNSFFIATTSFVPAGRPIGIRPVGIRPTYARNDLGGNFWITAGVWNPWGFPGPFQQWPPPAFNPWGFPGPFQQWPGNLGLVRPLPAAPVLPLVPLAGLNAGAQPAFAAGPVPFGVGGLVHAPFGQFAGFQ